ncbi:MAG: hypothetical protein AAB877_01260 [Patescibacteria group bacterium]
MTLEDMQLKSEIRESRMLGEMGEVTEGWNLVFKGMALERPDIFQIGMMALLFKRNLRKKEKE